MDTLITTATCLILPPLIVTLGYLGLCAVAPFKRCRRCQGTGHKRLMLGRTRLCRRCQGIGHHLRLGPKMLNHLRRFATELERGRR
ncbi:hypothetical protein Rhe02_98670 [Rhizocola hellebori]|uniref:Uncharacterized protein n=1 Tax=Rhizocola hellebori TaxID=1392758 RepID=A0A8J3VMB5_9ACTN|nr:hypothetical protein [Rhizocola hellebori]GIH11800.1 hypothetical protein Rhe02_98670 [Rhizocola hellebori]